MRGTWLAYIVGMVTRALPFLFLIACAGAASSADDDGASSEDQIVTSEMRASADDACTATFVFWQKDAYKDVGGRTNDLWPPHTTTQLEVSCQTAEGEQHIAPFKENYGSKPGQKDKNGNDLLVRVQMDPHVVTVHAPWRDMKNLVASYEDCGCDPQGFLGLDTIDADGKQLFEELAPILTCPDGSDAILAALKDRRYDDAKRMAAACRLKDGVTQSQLAETASQVDAEVKKTLAEHHVCNNNAELQADLFVRFRDHDDAHACDPHDRALCYGPKLFYSPAREVR